MDQFIKAIGLQKYSPYLQDYGDPIGMRVAIAHPEKSNLYYHTEMLYLMKKVYRRYGKSDGNIGKTERLMSRQLLKI